MAVKKQTYEENISEIDKILEKFENEEILVNVNYFDFMDFFKKLNIDDVKVFGGFNETEFILEKSQPLIFVITKKV